MITSSRVITASSLIQKEENLLEFNGEIYLNIKQSLKFLALTGRELEEKDLNFRRNSPKLGDDKINYELRFEKIKGSRNQLMCNLKELQTYVLKLYQLSIDLSYNDAKIVVNSYDQVLQQPKKYGMRGQRNFTGKIEDEIRGKLAEHSFSQYIYNLTNIDLPVDYSSVSGLNNQRDAGDFTKFVSNNQIFDLPEGVRISLKSTNGNYLALPVNEIDWEGEIFVLVKLHLKETFLYQAIKAGLKLAELNLSDNLGWLEVRGFIFKDEFKSSYISDKLPDGTEFRSPNYIKAPIQLNQNISILTSLIHDITATI
jgi:DNA (cytosine-5)-methyltransferase 1